MLSSLLIFGLAAGGGRGGSNRTLTIVIGVIVGVIALVLVISIASSLVNKARTAPAATQTQIVEIATAIAGFTPSVTPGVPPTQTPIPPPTEAPTYTPIPTLPLEPPALSPTPLPFQPVGGRSFYMPRLKQPGAIPIVDLPLVNGAWDVSGLGHSVGHLQATSWVGTTGNTVLVAHIQLTATDFGPFLLLRQVQIGDLAYVADYGQIYEYQVTSISTVDPSDVEITYPTVAPELTLITCTGWDNYQGAFLKRFVATAKLISPVPPPTGQPQT
jgi:LPXTG-site transpeptidase (sortase) family protein